MTSLSIRTRSLGIAPSRHPASALGGGHAASPRQHRGGGRRDGGRSTSSISNVTSTISKSRPTAPGPWTTTSRPPVARARRAAFTRARRPPHDQELKCAQIHDDQCRLGLATAEHRGEPCLVRDIDLSLGTHSGCTLIEGEVTREARDGGRESPHGGRACGVEHLDLQRSRVRVDGSQETPPGSARTGLRRECPPGAQATHGNDGHNARARLGCATSISPPCSLRYRQGRA